MGRLKEQDLVAVVDCLRDVYALTDIDTFAEQLISRLRKVLHLEHIFEKLGVENRTAAAGLILSQQKRTTSSVR